MLKKYVWVAVLFAVLFIHNASAQSATTGLWQDLSTTDALSGKKIAAIAISPTADSDNEFQDTGIYIKCTPDNQLQLYIVWNQKLASAPGQFEFDYRIGQNPVQNENWDLSTDFYAGYYPGNVVAFLQQLESSSVFVVQVTPEGMSPINATYNTAGLVNAVIPVLKACGFNQPQS